MDATVERLRGKRSVDEFLRDLGYRIEARPDSGSATWQLYRCGTNEKIGPPTLQTEIVANIERKPSVKS